MLDQVQRLLIHQGLLNHCPVVPNVLHQQRHVKHLLDPPLTFVIQLDEFVFVLPTRVWVALTKASCEIQPEHVPRLYLDLFVQVDLLLLVLRYLEVWLLCEAFALLVHEVVVRCSCHEKGLHGFQVEFEFRNGVQEEAEEGSMITSVTPPRSPMSPRKPYIFLV